MEVEMLSSNSFVAEHLADKKQISLLADQSFKLSQFEGAEAEILEYYDRNCKKAIECNGCARSIYIEKAIVTKHGITNFRKFDELFSRNYY